MKRLVSLFLLFVTLLMSVCSNAEESALLNDDLPDIIMDEVQSIENMDAQSSEGNNPLTPILFDGYIFYKGSATSYSGDWESLYTFNIFTTYNQASSENTASVFAVGLYTHEGIAKTDPDDYMLIIDSQMTSVFTALPMMTSCNHWNPSDNNVLTFETIKIIPGRNLYKLEVKNDERHDTNNDYHYFILRDLPETIDISISLVHNAALLNLSPKNQFKGKKWVAYGDSITGQGSWEYIVYGTLGLKYENHGLGGSCVADNPESDIPGFCDADRIAAIPSDADIITIMGGANDFDQTERIGSVKDLYTSFDKTSFIGAIAYLVKEIQNQAPDARIILMSNVNSRGAIGKPTDTPVIDKYGHSTYDYAVAMREVAEFMSFDFIDVYSCGINPVNREKYIIDEVHPNVEGGKLIGRKVLEFFKQMQFP